jgi:hypothetical protein
VESVRRLLAALFVLLTSTRCSKAPDHAALEREIATTLDAWHAAAARADEEAHFSAFARSGVFLGTDARSGGPWKPSAPTHTRTSRGARRASPTKSSQK